MKLYFSSSWLLLVVATPSVIAKKGKKTKTNKNQKIGPVGGSELNLNCDPQTDTLPPYADNSGKFNVWYDNVCKNDDCASDMWKDGCLACMCYNVGNASWCDGTKSVYYDTYFDKHGENPFGDSNRSNRKCNTNFSQQDVPCKWDWECDIGITAGCSRLHTGTHPDPYLCCLETCEDMWGVHTCKGSRWC